MDTTGLSWLQGLKPTSSLSISSQRESANCQQLSSLQPHPHSAVVWPLKLMGSAVVQTDSQVGYCTFLYYWVGVGEG